MASIMQKLLIHQKLKRKSLKHFSEKFFFHENEDEKFKAMKSLEQNRSNFTGILFFNTKFSIFFQK